MSVITNQKTCQELDRVAFQQTDIIQNSIETHPGQIDSSVFIVGHHLHEGTTDRRRVHYAVTAAPGRHEEVAVVRVVADDQILVEVVVVIVTGPGALQLATQQNIIHSIRRLAPC